MDLKIKYTLTIDDDRRSDLREVDEVLQIKEVCGWYNKDKHGNYCKDEKYIKYLHLPPDLSQVHFDLNRLHQNDIWKPAVELEEKIDTILKWITLNSQDQDAKPKLPDADFVCFRGLLYRLMCVRYDKSNSLKLCARKVKGTTYLCQFFTEQNRKQQKEDRENPALANPTRWGHVFEHYLVADAPGKIPDPSQPMSEYEEFNCVFRSKVGQHTIIYGAEIDGLKKQEDLNDLFKAQFIELKTCKQNPNPNSFKKYKLMKWWAQSVLAKIDTLIVGYRDDDGIVNSLQEIKVKDIPKIAKGWKALHCISFLKDFLNFVKYVMRDAQSKDVFEFVWYPNSEYEARKLPEGNECGFLPDWYESWLQNFD